MTRRRCLCNAGVLAELLSSDTFDSGAVTTVPSPAAQASTHPEPPIAQEGPMKALTRRKMLSAALACGVFAELEARTVPAEADLFGGDIAVLVAILTQSISSALSLTSLVLQTVNQVRMMTTMLQQVSQGSFPALIAFINTARSTYNSLTWGVRSMSYQLARIDSEYQ